MQSWAVCQNKEGTWGQGEVGVTGMKKVMFSE